ncbi:hypothetical protein F5884DRAFT_151178 [Xylogone sp. PMI_703]|nr:hypothetical protein F5884DRAFT_151178 [Xylogone sp. PMI_703]
MPITEFVFPKPKADPITRQELKNKLPEFLADCFSGTSGLLGLYLGEILDLSFIKEPSASDYSDGGVCLLLEWDQQTSFENFFASSKFGGFKSSFLPYVAGPSMLELFESDERSIATTSAPYTQVIRLVLPEMPDAKQQVESLWNSFTAVLVSLQERKSRDSPDFFSGQGMKNVQGVFVGIIGWKSLKIIEEVHANLDVSRFLNLFKENSKEFSTFIVQLEKQAL